MIWLALGIFGAGLCIGWGLIHVADALRLIAAVTEEPN